MLQRAESLGRASRGLDFEIMSLPVPERQGVNQKALLRGECEQGGRVESAA